MKKIISTLVIAFCLVNYSNAQVMDSSVTKKPGHNQETTKGDTTHVTKMRRQGEPVKNHKQGADTATKATINSRKKTNPGMPSASKPQ
jgi:hypothetical protein